MGRRKPNGKSEEEPKKQKKSERIAELEKKLRTAKRATKRVEVQLDELKVINAEQLKRLGDADMLATYVKELKAKLDALTPKT